jgi:hypothetical protein
MGNSLDIRLRQVSPNLAETIIAKVTESAGSTCRENSDPAFKTRANRISDQFLKPSNASLPVRGEHTTAFGDAAVATCLKPFAHMVILAVHAVPQLPHLFNPRATLI